MNNDVPFIRNNITYEDILIYHCSNASPDYGHLDICKKKLYPLKEKKLNNPKVITYNKNIKTIIYFYNKYYKPNQDKIDHILTNINVNINNTSILTLNTNATLETSPIQHNITNKLIGVKTAGTARRKKRKLRINKTKCKKRKLKRKPNY